MEQPVAMPASARITIERVHSPTDEVRCLVAELESELAANYPAEQRHGLAIEAIFQPHIRFFIARLGREAVGCGGVALFKDFAEIKRMYVKPAARGRARGGVAEAIVGRLREETVHADLRVIRLETGTQQLAAMRLYERCGFTRCDAFEPYASMPTAAISTSVFMEMHIDAR